MTRPAGDCKPRQPSATKDRTHPRQRSEPNPSGVREMPTIVRDVTDHCYTSLILDVWPRAAAIVDFGLKSVEHYGALQHAIKHNGITREQLDAALGDGPAITKLVNDANRDGRNPYAPITFVTDWDDLDDVDE